MKEPQTQSTWQTKEGEEVSISNLDDNHLRNIYEMLRKQKKEYLPIRAEMIRRGFTDTLVLSNVIEPWELRDHDPAHSDWFWK